MLKENTAVRKSRETCSTRISRQMWCLTPKALHVVCITKRLGWYQKKETWIILIELLLITIDKCLVGKYYRVI